MHILKSKEKISEGDFDILKFLILIINISF